MKKLLKIILVILLTNCLPAVTATAGNPQQMVRRGNQFYENGQYPEAEKEYRRALEEGLKDPGLLYNLGNALYRQGRFEEAARLFEGLSSVSDPGFDRSRAFHNLGNALVESQEYGKGIEAYRNALRLNPEDDDTRHNLEYAMHRLQDPPPSQDPQPGEDDQEQDEGEDETPSQPQDGEGRQDAAGGQQAPRPETLSPQDAQRILDALNQQEQAIQESIKREESPARTRQTERAW
jgi:Ca-activated chloride channel family protein